MPTLHFLNTLLLQEQSIYSFELLKKGGLTMIILGILSVYAIYLFSERLSTIRKAQKKPEKLLNEVKERVLSGDIDGALASCERDSTPMSRMLHSGVSHIGANLKTIEASIENVGKLELYRLEKNLSNLATVAGAAPMIGFLGTVLGMIKTFMTIAQDEGEVTTKALSGGIYEAMVTTAGGLVVGIIAYIGYNYLVSQISKVVYSMELTSIEFVDLLQRPN